MDQNMTENKRELIMKQSEKLYYVAGLLKLIAKRNDVPITAIAEAFSQTEIISNVLRYVMMKAIEKCPKSIS